MEGCGTLSGGDELEDCSWGVFKGLEGVKQSFGCFPSLDEFSASVGASTVGLESVEGSGAALVVGEHTLWVNDKFNLSTFENSPPPVKEFVDKF